MKRRALIPILLLLAACSSTHNTTGASTSVEASTSVPQSTSPATSDTSTGTTVTTTVATTVPTTAADTTTTGGATTLPPTTAPCIATGDTHHVTPTLLALAAGYHVLLEKPMALDEVDCRRIVEAAAAADRSVAVCHVYRHSHLFRRLHEVIESGALGDVLTIQLSENVAYWHYAHSYVRGHTRRSEVPWLLQKSCHDLDLLSWIAGAPAAQVSSFLRRTWPGTTCACRHRTRD